MKVVRKSVEIGERPLTFEVGRLAQQATSSVLASYGDTTVLATVVAAKHKTELSYFPLFIEYIERLYAGGRIKGSRWVKREGRPSDDAILSARLIDRSVRPLFPSGYVHEVQVIITILSVDGENEPDIIALNAVSAALSISGIPWDGPVGAVRLGYVSPKNGNEGHLLVNPSETEIDFCDMNLVASSTDKNVIMIEADAKEVGEDISLTALATAKKEAQKIVQTIKELKKEVGLKPQVYEDTDPDKKLLTTLTKDFKKEIDTLYTHRINKQDEQEDLADYCEQAALKFEDKYSKRTIEKAFDYLVKKKIRTAILKKDQRPGGRKLDDVRSISVEVGVLPRTHGSALFSRGQTQVLTVATLGAPSLEQLIESPLGEESKRYMHHYNMPPYSVGETGRMGFPKRREVGHGALAERSLLSVIPSEEKFPYTIRLVSEVLSSNGSTSMAATCGSTLALMDAGVPIKNPIAGISIGLIEEGDKYKLLTDIIGLEDFCGDMDFKVAGSKDGITSIQLDVKNAGLTDKIIKESLEKARVARLSILKDMLSVISKSRAKLSQYAPKVAVVKVPQDKIGEVIGPGGRVIRSIIAETGATVDVDDEGVVSITGTTEDSVQRAKNWVEGLVKEVQAGEIYEGEVKRLMPFGAFVELVPGKEGLVHVSQMSTEYVGDPSEVVKLGDKVKIRVKEVDEHGRINLSMLFGEDAKKKTMSRPKRKFSPKGRSSFRRRR